MATWQFFTLLGFLALAFRGLFGGLSHVLEPMLDRAKAVDDKLTSVIKLLEQIESRSQDMAFHQPAE